jgi:hypothetical protein
VRACPGRFGASRVQRQQRCLLRTTSLALVTLPFRTNSARPKASKRARSPLVAPAPVTAPPLGKYLASTGSSAAVLWRLSTCHCSRHALGVHSSTQLKRLELIMNTRSLFQRNPSATRRSRSSRASSRALMRTAPRAEEDVSRRRRCRSSGRVSSTVSHLYLVVSSLVERRPTYWCCFCAWDDRD